MRKHTPADRSNIAYASARTSTEQQTPQNSPPAVRGSSLHRFLRRASNGAIAAGYALLALVWWLLPADVRASELSTVALYAAILGLPLMALTGEFSFMLFARFARAANISRFTDATDTRRRLLQAGAAWLIVFAGVVLFTGLIVLVLAGEQSHVVAFCVAALVTLPLVVGANLLSYRLFLNSTGHTTPGEPDEKLLRHKLGTAIPRQQQETPVHRQPAARSKRQPDTVSYRQADLQGADLQGADLQGADLQGANLSRANLNQADLHGADLRRAILAYANLNHANLNQADLQGADLRRVSLQNASLQATRLTDANFNGTDFRQVDLQGVNLSEVHLNRANFSRANLRAAHLHGSGLSLANLQQADLQRADLSQTILTEANVPGANLQEADLRDADLRGADLQGADLTGADLRGADLRGADVTEADLTDCRVTPEQLALTRPHKTRTLKKPHPWPR